MVVDESGGLHECVANRGADEAKAALEQGFAQQDGEIGFGRNLLEIRPAVLDGLAADEIPNEIVEGAEFFLNLQEGFGVGDGGLDFEPIADDAGILEQDADFLGVVASDFGGIEATEEFAVTFALLENGVPAEASLSAFEDEEFEPAVVVVDGNAPFFVVVSDAERVGGPGAADELFFCGHVKKDSSLRLE